MATIAQKQAMRRRWKERAAAGDPVSGGRRLARVLANKPKAQRYTIQGSRTDAAQQIAEREKATALANQRREKAKNQLATLGTQGKTAIEGVGTEEKKTGWFQSVINKIKSGFSMFSERQAELTKATEGATMGAVPLVGLGGLGIKGISSILKKFGLRGATKAGTGKMLQTRISGGAAFQVNTKTATQTRTMISKIIGGIKKVISNPIIIAGGLMGAIGSYPFAGFIKEESLQTLGLGVGAAIRNKDLTGAEEALQLQRDILNPDMWDEIMAKVPYVNVLANLKDFYDSAETKLAIDEKIVENMKIQTETGETDSDMWARIRAEQDQQDRLLIDYYNEERKKLLEWEETAADRDMKEDAAFWAKERAKQRKLEKEDREAIRDFWIAYRKEKQKFQMDERPSNLSFGGLF